MASLIKRPKSRFWVACFTDRNGRRLKRSTKTVDRKLAMKIANEFEEAAQKKRTVLQARRVLTELHRQISGNELAHTSYRTFVNSWIERKTPEIVPTTLSFYRN